jgi:hypothetical protein
MPDDTPPIPRRKPNVLWLIAVAFGLLFALFAYQLLGPNPPIRVSKQTTYITTPLLPSGLPDYEASELQRQRGNITPCDNAAILLWQAFWDGELSSQEHAEFCAELHLDPVPDSSRSLERLDSQPQQDIFTEWLESKGVVDADDELTDETIAMRSQVPGHPIRFRLWQTGSSATRNLST